jgi:multidrug efflux pump subunit AcrB
MLIAMLAVGGLSSYFVLPRMEDPVLTPRAALVTTLYPVADAEQVEALVTDRIEDALKEVEAIKEIRSQSRSGVSVVSIELRDDIYESATVWSKIRGKIEDSIALLPPEASRPEFDDLDVRAFAWIGGLVWESDQPANYAILRRFAEDLDDRMRGISGTDDVQQFGAPREEVLVAVEPDRLANVGLSTTDVARSLSDDDARNSAGFVRSARSSMPIELANQLTTLESIRRLPIKTDPNGQFVMLSDVATVDRQIADPPGELGWIDGRPAVLIGAMVQEQSRIDLWRERLETTLEEYRSQLPPSIQLREVLDQNHYVNLRLSGLLSNLALGALAVLAVVWLLMGWRNALMVSTALPLVSLAVLSGMRTLSIPVHQMSVAGLIIALGLLIDNAIVIVDSVSGQLRLGKSPGEAVRTTAKILFVPLLGSTLTTGFAFAPIYLMQGPAGEFVGAMALNVMLAVGSSLVISLIIIAPLAALLDQLGRRRRVAKNPEKPMHAAGLRPGFLKPLFKRLLLTTLHFPKTTIALSVAVACTGFFCLTQLPEQFFPPADRDQFHVELEMPQNASFDATLAMATAVGQELRNHPRITSTTWLLGRSAPTFYYNIITRRKNAKEYGQAIVQLDSPENAREIIQQVQSDLQRKFPTARLLVRQLEQGPPFTAPVEIRFFGPELNKLREYGEKARRLLSEIPEVVHTRIELNDITPTIQYNVDTEAARLAGLVPANIARQLNSQLEGENGGFVLQATEQLPVRVRVNDAAREDLGSLQGLDLVSATTNANEMNNRIPMSALGTLTLTPKAATVSRLNGVRMQEVQGFLSAGTLPSDALRDVRKRLDSPEWELPPGYRMEFGGEASKRNDAVGNLLASVGILVAAMITTLVLSIGSFRGASIIGAVALMAVSFGGMSLWIFGFPFGFMAIIGIMGLIGIAINDSIVVLTALRQDPSANSGDPNAIVDIVLHETRHVLATTFTTVAGFLPLILSGGGFWPPMAVGIAGGVVGCTALALIFVPCSFSWLIQRNQIRLDESLPLASAPLTPATSEPSVTQPSRDVSSELVSTK